MRLLILGGTRYLSKTVARIALERGHDVTVANRGLSGEPPPGARSITIDRSTPEGVAPLAGETFDAVVDVARLPAHVKNAADVLGDRVGHWGFVSTCNVYTDDATPGQTPATAPLHEPQPDDGADPDMDLYGPNKVTCENLVRDRYGDRAFIVRAGLIVGADDPGDRFGYWPWRIAQGGEILAPGEPGDSVQWIDVEDHAAWMVDAAEKGLGGTYDGKRPPTTRTAFLTELVDGLAPDATLTWVPQSFLEEHGVKPWMGEDSLPLWLPLPEYAGFCARDTRPSIDAGMPCRSALDTARRWLDWNDGSPAAKSGISREREAELLAAWHRHAGDTT